MDVGFPETSLYKLYLRRTQCFYHLNERELAKIELQNTNEMVTCLKTSLGNNKYESVMKTLEDLRQCLTEGKMSMNKDRNHCERVTVPSVFHGKNQVITQASSAIDMKFTTEQGRYLVCNQDMSAGDTLIVERPYSAVLLPDHYTTHCHHCYHQLTSIVQGCRRCVTVRYCSSICESEAWRAYHHIECAYLDILHSIGIAHLSLRTILIAGKQLLQGFGKEKSEMMNGSSGINNIPGLNGQGCYERNYQSVYDLMTHTDDIQSPDLYLYSLTATLLLVILIHSGWFHPNQDSMESPDSDCDIKSLRLEDRIDIQHWETVCNNILPSRASDNEQLETLNVLYMSELGVSSEMLDIGGLLLRHIQQIVCNAHAITEHQSIECGDSSPVETRIQVRLVTAIYPTASLINHSCDPNIISSFHGDVLIVRAAEDVKKGEEIFNCYGPHHRRMKRSKRQEILTSQYFFKCSCKPCSEERKGDIQFNASICSQCRGCVDILNDEPGCVDCGMKESSTSIEARKEINQLLQQGISLIDQSNSPGAIMNLQSCLKLCKKFLHKNNIMRGSIEDNLARCYAMSGDHKEALIHLEESIKITELLYGADSIEVAYELQKMADILFNARKPEQTLQTINRALDIFHIHFGDSHGTVKELLEMKECLLDFIGTEVH